jgi:2'-5' RNA ligase
MPFENEDEDRFAEDEDDFNPEPCVLSPPLCLVQHTMACAAKPELARLFLAAELEPAVRERLSRFRETFPAGAWRIAWVRPPQLHLTLIFLGDTLCESIPMVQAAMNDVGRDKTAFPMALGGLGWFGRPLHPRVIWAKVDEPSRRLTVIQKAIDAKLRSIGFFWPPEEFVEHVTLGRVKSDHSAGELARVLDGWPREEYGTSEVTGLTLVQSVLTASGPDYRVRHLARFHPAEPATPSGRL